MNVLCVNCGSSTLKFDLWDVSRADEILKRKGSGLIDRVGAEATLSLSVEWTRFRGPSGHGELLQ